MQIHYQRFNKRKVISSKKLNWLVVKDYDKAQSYIIPFVYNKDYTKVMVLIDNQIFEKDLSELQGLELYPATEESRKEKQKIRQEITNEMFCKIIKHYTNGEENIFFFDTTHEQYIFPYKNSTLDKIYHASSDFKYVEVDKLPQLATMFSESQTHSIKSDLLNQRYGIKTFRPFTNKYQDIKVTKN